MEEILSSIGLLSIALLVLYIIRKIFECNKEDDENKIYKFEQDEEN